MGKPSWVQTTRRAFISLLLTESSWAAASSSCCWDFSTLVDSNPELWTGTNPSPKADFCLDILSHQQKWNEDKGQTSHPLQIDSRRSISMFNYIEWLSTLRLQAAPLGSRTVWTQCQGTGQRFSWLCSGAMLTSLLGSQNIFVLLPGKRYHSWLCNKKPPPGSNNSTQLESLKTHSSKQSVFVSRLENEICFQWTWNTLDSKL